MTARRLVVAGLLLFVATRVGALWLAQHPQVYGPDIIDATFDVSLYEQWAHDMVDDGRRPYSDLEVAYPPAAIAFFVVPRLVGGPSGSYRAWWFAEMLGVDAAGFAALLVMARRGARQEATPPGPAWTAWGVVFWAVVPPLIGPVLYSRFDLVPAVAMLWALERAQANRWGGTGGWLGFGAASKLVPGFLAPLAVIVSPRRWTTAIWFAVVSLVWVVPFLGDPADLASQVLGYHAFRGVQIESTWSAGLLIASRLGYQVTPVLGSGSVQAESGISPLLQTVSNGAVLAALALGVLVAWRRVQRADPGGFALVSLGTLALMVGMGRVYSPQYAVWLVAAAAGALALAGGRAIWPAVAVLAVAVLTHLVFPVLIFRILEAQTIPLGVLVARDLATLAAGGLALWAAARPRSPVAPPAEGAAMA